MAIALHVPALNINVEDAELHQQQNQQPTVKTTGMLCYRGVDGSPPTQYPSDLKLSTLDAPIKDLPIRRAKYETGSRHVVMATRHQT